MSELRQRRKAPTSQASGVDSEVIETIRRLDYYPKVHDEFVVKTRAGAALSLLSAIFILFLLVTEFSSYLEVTTKDQIVVDAEFSRQIDIHFNVSFPHLTCAEVSLDAMDVSGEQHVNIMNNIYKWRRSANGEPINHPYEEKISRPVELPENYCGSCFGAGEANQCCNTCEDLIAAYEKRGWNSLDVQNSEQCKREPVTPSSASQPGEGCSVFGVLTVNQVAGNFHTAIGKSRKFSSRHVHQFTMADVAKFNISHTIHRLSFGLHVPGVVNPLDNVVRTVPQGTGTYYYFIKIVPTTYRALNGKEVVTNQYSVTEQFKPLKSAPAVAHSHAHNHDLPGVFFVYDFAPFHVEVEETRAPFTHFLTNVCAIIGGVLTVSGLVASMLYHSTQALKKGNHLG